MTGDDTPDAPYGSRWHAESTTEGWIDLYLIDSRLPEDTHLKIGQHNFRVGICGATPRNVASMAHQLIHKWNGTTPPSKETLSMVDLINSKRKLA
jgi:hypothetical protein